MRLIKYSSLLCCSSLLIACASGPNITLQPADVPSLYGDFSTVAVEVPGAAALESPAREELQRTAGEIADAQVAKAGGNVRQGVEDQCAAMQAELSKLDAGLGAPAQESAPSAPRTGMQKTGSTLYNLGVGTLMGQLEIFRQTKRAIFGDAEKERLRAEA
ncbi:MAG: hypothetical protein HKO07_04235, partial [Pseudomonadales bacterium]|nr:hypothetical protein [Pseudomonadales bacterium]